MAGKRYFVGHTGFPSGSSNSTSREEHLAIALWNAEQTFMLPDGQTLELLDYQFPLKARQSDKGVGKVDLISVLGGIQPGVIELKIHTFGAGQSDTPLRAFLEALAYCALVEANAEDIAEEAMDNFGLKITEPRPVLIVMAPKKYWIDYLNHPKAGHWWPALHKLADQLNEKLNLQSHFIAIQGAKFEMGSRDKKPHLNMDCSLRDLADFA
jgi:hypothetical protein